MNQLEQIRAEIERLNNKYKYLSSIEAKHKSDCYADLLSFINSLPEEQPSEDLEKEIKDKYSRDTSTLKTRAQYEKFARYFYELGFNARTED